MPLDNRIKTFLTLVELKSYTQTAKELYITQPAVTQQVKSLEKEFNTQLVHYGGRTLTITEDGLELADFLRSINSQVDRFQEVFKKSKENQQIKFSATHSLSEHLVPEVSKFLLGRGYKSISCTIAKTDHSLELLRNGEIEFSLIEGNFVKNEFANEVLYQESFIAVASKDNPLAKLDRPISLKEILNQNLITREKGSGTREILNSILSNQNVDLEDFNSVIEIGDISALRTLLLQNQGISFVYESVVEEQINNKELVELQIENSNAAHDIYFVYRKNDYYEDEYQDLIKSIKDNAN